MTKDEFAQLEDAAKRRAQAGIKLTVEERAEAIAMFTPMFDELFEPASSVVGYIDAAERRGLDIDRLRRQCDRESGAFQRTRDSLQKTITRRTGGAA